VLVVGSSGLDTIETEKETVRDVLGGSAIYFAAAASMFAPVRVVSIVGEDFPEEGRSGLARRDVDLAGLEVVPGGRTFRWAGRYSADMNERETLLTELNVLGDFEPKLPDEYKATPYVFLANGPTATQHAVLDQLETDSSSHRRGRGERRERRDRGNGLEARGNRTPCSALSAVKGVRTQAYVAADTMNLWIDTERDELTRLLSRTDLLILNDEEARMISGRTALWDAAREITKLGPTTVALKKGEHGSYLVGRGGPCAVPSFPLESLVDPTGAGDSFAGAFMGYIARAESTEPETLRAALAVASVTASFTCESFGPKRLFEVTMDEVNSRLDVLRELVRF
ncbi:MAG: PfkB family carbohydrate kinase, partial [Planctomycetota bacterium]